MSGTWRTPWSVAPARDTEHLVHLPDGRQVRAVWQRNALIAHWVGADGTRYRGAGSMYFRPPAAPHERSL